MHDSFSDTLEEKLKDIDKKIFFINNKNTVNINKKLDDTNNKIEEIEKNYKIELDDFNQNQKS